MSESTEHAQITGDIIAAKPEDISAMLHAAVKAFACDIESVLNNPNLSNSMTIEGIRELVRTAQS